MVSQVPVVIQLPVYFIYITHNLGFLGSPLKRSEMAFDNKPAADSDDINLALNYFSVSERVNQFAQQNQFELIETMAERVAALIMQEFSVTWIKLTLHKPGALAKAQSLGVQIERGIK